MLLSSDLANPCKPHILSSVPFQGEMCTSYAIENERRKELISPWVLTSTCLERALEGQGKWGDL